MGKNVQVINTRNRRLSMNLYMDLDTRHTDLNNNILVLGGSGAGKSFKFVKPNFLQLSTSFVCTDPKGELERDCAGFLRKYGYQIRVIDIRNAAGMKRSTRYNPFRYIRTDVDILKLISNLISNTTPKGTSASDPFWEKAEGMLLQALFYYVWLEGVDIYGDGRFHHTVRAVMHLIKLAEFKEDESGQKQETDLDRIFAALEDEKPDHPAVLCYNKVMRGAADTVRSIIISANSRLAPLQSDEILSLLDDDEMDIPGIGAEKTAVFCVIPDVDKTFNFLIGLLYTQMFQELYIQADNVYGGRLPVHVTFMLDEFANVALPDDFCSLLTTMRSREISSVIIIQNLAQIKALFEKTWETIPGNCDTLIYLGGNEQSTHESMSKLLGKMTIDKRSSGETLGKQGSSSRNYDALGREMMLPEEVRCMDNDYCLVVIRGFKPVFDRKILPLEHPLWGQMCEASSYRFDARLERAGRRNMDVAIHSAAYIKRHQLEDSNAREAYEKESEICAAVGEPLPPEPVPKVLELSYEQVMALDLDTLSEQAGEKGQDKLELTQEEAENNLKAAILGQIRRRETAPEESGEETEDIPEEDTAGQGEPDGDTPEEREDEKYQKGLFVIEMQRRGFRVGQTQAYLPLLGVFGTAEELLKAVDKDCTEEEIREYVALILE